MPWLNLLIMVDVPLVSVLMTSFNREKYIGFAIESILSSTYKDFELIIVDDASTDSTVAKAREYAEKDNRIKLYINERNLGDYPNRNKAASLARGKYLKYVDSDDYIYPNGLEILIHSMEQFPDAGYGLCSLIPDKGRPFPFMLSPREAYEYHFFGPGLFHKGPLTSIFLRAAFEAIGGFKPGRMIGDTDLWHRIGLHYPTVLMQDGIVWQRRHTQQELALQHEYIFKRERIKWEYLTDPACKLLPQQLRAIKKQRLSRYTGFILSGLRRLDMKRVGIYIKCFLFVSKINIKG